jgi:hypothetical protein
MERSGAATAALHLVADVRSWLAKIEFMAGMRVLVADCRRPVLIA